jgi:hypothetical protein
MKYIKSRVLFESYDTDFDDIISNCRYILLDLADMGIRTYVHRSKTNNTFSSGKVVSTYQIDIYVNNLVGADNSYLLDIRSRLIDYLASEGFDYVSSNRSETSDESGTAIYGMGGVRIDGVSRHNLWKFKKG